MRIIKGQKINLEKADALVIPVFENANLAPVIAGCPEAELFVKRYKFTGKTGEEIVFYSASWQKLILLVGAGSANRQADVAKLAKTLVMSLKQKNTKKVFIHFLQNLADLGINREFWKNFVDFLFINDYSFDTYKKSKEKKEELEHIAVYVDDESAAALLTPSFIKDREVIAREVARVRNLVNETPAALNPDSLVEEFKRTAAELKMDLLVLREKELLAQGLNGILAVGQASPFDSALVRLSYIPDHSLKTIALVGKGITFDSGGLALKSRSGMTNMKCDMSGAAVILGVIAAVAKLQVPVILDAYAPIAENMPGEYAYKPGEILTFRNEKTVEIVDTDCEGRLLLADALTVATDEKPGCIIELSTLTGSITNALGDGIAGVMGTDESLVSLLLEAGQNTGERLCQLPLPEDYKESIQSKVADLKNANYGSASAIKAALFLKEFTGNIPFVHIDIAGTAFLSKANNLYSQEGATGFGVRLIMEFLDLWLKKIKNN